MPPSIGIGIVRGGAASIGDAKAGAFVADILIGGTDDGAEVVGKLVDVGFGSTVVGSAVVGSKVGFLLGGSKGKGVAGPFVGLLVLGDLEGTPAAPLVVGATVNDGVSVVAGFEVVGTSNSFFVAVAVVAVVVIVNSPTAATFKACSTGKELFSMSSRTMSKLALT